MSGWLWLWMWLSGWVWMWLSGWVWMWLGVDLGTLDPSAAALLARMASLSLAKASSRGFSTSLSRMVTSSPKVRQLPVMKRLRSFFWMRPRFSGAIMRASSWASVMEMRTFSIIATAFMMCSGPRYPWNSWPEFFS